MSISTDYAWWLLLRMWRVGEPTDLDTRYHIFLRVPHDSPHAIDPDICNIMLWLGNFFLAQVASWCSGESCIMLLESTYLNIANYVKKQSLTILKQKASGQVDTSPMMVRIATEKVQKAKAFLQDHFWYHVYLMNRNVSWIRMSYILRRQDLFKDGL